MSMEHPVRVRCGMVFGVCPRFLRKAGPSVEHGGSNGSWKVEGGGTEELRCRTFAFQDVVTIDFNSGQLWILSARVDWSIKFEMARFRDFLKGNKNGQALLLSMLRE